MSENLIGVIIGAVAAILGGAVGSMVTYYFNRRMFIQKEKKLTYELAYEVLVELEESNPFRDKEYLRTKEFRDKCNRTHSRLVLYAPSDIVDLYTRLLEILDSGGYGSVRYEEYCFYSEQLVSKMRKDLGA